MNESECGVAYVLTYLTTDALPLMRSPHNATLRTKHGRFFIHNLNIT
jgi:hypothetical protein